MTRSGAAVAVLGTAVILGGAAPAWASFASLASRDGGMQLQVSGGPGEANDIEVTFTAGSYVVVDAAGITPGSGCSGGGTMVTCPDPGGTVLRTVIAPADGADEVVLKAQVPSLLIGGPGPDRLIGGPLRDRALGVGGPDVVRGRGGDDRLVGGRRDDRLTGGSGRDRLQGEGGADVLRARDGRIDRVSGGGGRDTAVIDRKDVVRGVEQVSP